MEDFAIVCVVCLWSVVGLLTLRYWLGKPPGSVIVNTGIDGQMTAWIKQRD
jgi:hypothetical protein